MGPLVGFTISGYCLSIHADFIKATVSAQPGDPNWIGAWWLTYATFGVLMILVSVPIALFPKRVRRRSGQEGRRSGQEERRGQEEITQEQTEVTNGTGMHNTTTLHKSGKTKYAHAIGKNQNMETKPTHSILFLLGSQLFLPNPPAQYPNC